MRSRTPLRETEAEAVAFVVCQSIGLETGTASADYIRLWNGDAKLLAESLEVVQRTAAVILGAISPRPPALRKRKSPTSPKQRQQQLRKFLERGASTLRRFFYLAHPPLPRAQRQ